MQASPTLVGFELIVSDLDTALTLLVDTLGLALVERRTSNDPAGEIAVVSAGSAAISLLQPADAGPGHVLPQREPRLSQIVLSVAGEDIADLATALAESGLSAQRIDDARFFVPPAVAAGLLGIEAAVVVTTASEDPQAGTA